ncbi:MAG: pyruvate synthase subunit PorB [Pseudomonadota bacterium]
MAVPTAKTIPVDEIFTSGHKACIGCGLATAVRLVCKVLGRNTIVVNATGCLEIISSCYPVTSWEIPWIHTLFENNSAVASGIETAYKVMKRKGRYPSDQPVKVVAMAGDGGTADIGIQALSGMMERNHNVLYVCYDNEAYMNTGIQRSGATPFGASTTTKPAGSKSIGQQTWKKNVPEIAVAHRIPYVATASPSHPVDLMKKVQKAMAIEGPAYLHILSTCPTGWRSATDTAMEQARLAVKSGVFPLYEVENGVWKMQVQKELTPVADYLKTQGRFRHLTEEDISKIQERVNAEYERLKKICAAFSE